MKPGWIALDDLVIGDDRSIKTPGSKSAKIPQVLSNVYSFGRGLGIPDVGRLAIMGHGP